VIRQASDHPEQHRELLFRQEVDLKVQMISAVALAAHAVLCDQDEGRDQHALERDDEREQSVRIRIESQPCWRSRVSDCPDPEQQDMEDPESEAAGNRGDAIADPLLPASLAMRVPLDLHDRMNVGRRRPIGPVRVCPGLRSHNMESPERAAANRDTTAIHLASRS
jgi:hypothetical protein